jgi:hypothetical protein
MSRLLCQLSYLAAYDDERFYTGFARAWSRGEPRGGTRGGTQGGLEPVLEVPPYFRFSPKIPSIMSSIEC